MVVPLEGETIEIKPRVVVTLDDRNGCPPSAAADVDFLVQDITLAQDAVIQTSSTFGRRADGRSDLILYVDGEPKDRFMTHTASDTWVSGRVSWSGMLTEGSHTISLRSPQVNVWGCGEIYGKIETVIFD